LPAIDSDQTTADATDLIGTLKSYRRVVIAFSGGVDSSVVAAAATKADALNAIAVTARSPSVPQWQLDWAVKIAKEIGIEHRIIDTNEFERAEYQRNDSKRCFFCKETLYESIHDAVAVLGQKLADGMAAAAIVSGTNADDLGDYRPGIEAGKIAGTRTPLADLGITKQRVRALAEWFGLSNHDLPASPCLASRVAYGVEVNPERLARIEQAEAWLRNHGFGDLRVRLHENELARIELTSRDFARACEPEFAKSINAELRRIGFRFVTIDMGGLESGSMNRELVSLGVASIAKAPCNNQEQS
jgi:pyridinium-3,5-biscarboxylic acid mononucleotide sulfurtransferase